MLAVGVERYGFRFREIAEQLQKIPGSVSRWVTDEAEPRMSDTVFAEQLTVLGDELRTTDSRLMIDECREVVIPGTE